MRALIVIGLLWATLISATEPYAVRARLFWRRGCCARLQSDSLPALLATFLVQGVIAHAFLAARELESD